MQCDRNPPQGFAKENSRKEVNELLAQFHDDCRNGRPNDNNRNKIIDAIKNLVQELNDDPLELAMADIYSIYAYHLSGFQLKQPFPEKYLTNLKKIIPEVSLVLKLALDEFTQGFPSGMLDKTANYNQKFQDTCGLYHDSDLPRGSNKKLDSRMARYKSSITAASSYIKRNDHKAYSQAAKPLRIAYEFHPNLTLDQKNGQWRLAGVFLIADMAALKFNLVSSATTLIGKTLLKAFDAQKMEKKPSILTLQKATEIYIFRAIHNIIFSYPEQAYEALHCALGLVNKLKQEHLDSMNEKQRQLNDEQLQFINDLILQFDPENQSLLKKNTSQIPSVATPSRERVPQNKPQTNSGGQPYLITATDEESEEAEVERKAEAERKAKEEAEENAVCIPQLQAKLKNLELKISELILMQAQNIATASPSAFKPQTEISQVATEAAEIRQLVQRQTKLIKNFKFPMSQPAGNNCYNDLSLILLNLLAENVAHTFAAQGKFNADFAELLPTLHTLLTNEYAYLSNKDQLTHLAKNTDKLARKSTTFRLFHTQNTDQAFDKYDTYVNFFNLAIDALKVDDYTTTAVYLKTVLLNTNHDSADQRKMYKRYLAIALLCCFRINELKMAYDLLSLAAQQLLANDDALDLASELASLSFAIAGLLGEKLHQKNIAQLAINIANQRGEERKISEPYLDMMIEGHNGKNDTRRHTKKSLAQTSDPVNIKVTLTALQGITFARKIEATVSEDAKEKHATTLQKKTKGNHAQ